ncbi:methyltransferase domain-containing protein [Flavobacterium johnsoniae]|uniref:methyltransferase domain-containing protein n=1 Tax=Flavobacterium johnsoniae TaxID=986 RepID=UPI0025AFB58A|nr:methyltransferase domain-containing protein [Flavobacterium johnsoniae]WJS95139.1 methyltransferase domain-containing protein [Flavobacterium johnsoniae]
MNIKKSIKNIFSRSKHKTKVGTLNEATRISWLEKTLKEIPEGKRILDAGAGEQQFKKFCSHLNYVSQDFAQYKPEQLDSGLQMGKWDYGNLDIISDIASIPENDNSFDAIMCTEVFEHIINPREAIKEFSRLLKDDGYLIITAPFCSLTHFAPYHFYTGFNKFFYEEELAKNGFTDIVITANGNYFEYIAQEVGRLSSVAKQYSNIQLEKKELDNIEQLKKILQKLSDNDTNSSELLCFGLHVKARKKCL